MLNLYYINIFGFLVYANQSSCVLLFSAIELIIMVMMIIITQILLDVFNFFNPLILQMLDDLIEFWILIENIIKKFLMAVPRKKSRNKSYRVSNFLKSTQSVFKVKGITMEKQ